MENKIKSFSGETCAHQEKRGREQGRVKFFNFCAPENEFEKDVLASESYTTCTCHGETSSRKNNFTIGQEKLISIYLIAFHNYIILSLALVVLSGH